MKIIREVTTYYDKKIMLIQSECRYNNRVNSQRTVTIKLVRVMINDTYRRKDQHGCKIFLEYFIPTVDKEKINLVCGKLNKIMNILSDNESEYLKLNKMR